MKRNIIIIIGLIVFSISGCMADYPVDEDGLLVTDREDCYVASFELLGADHQTVRPAIGGTPVIENPVFNEEGVLITEGAIRVPVRFGTNLRILWPQFSLSEDSKLEPKVTGWTDFSDLDNPKKYTVISGNRQIRRTYTVIITVVAK